MELQLTGHYDPTEPRNERGEWTFRNMVGGRQKVQTPTTFEHPDTGHKMGKSEIGDTFEALFARKGAPLIERHYGHPYIPVAGVPGRGKSGRRSTRTSPLDFKLDTKFGGELKTLNIDAKNQKTAIKKAELDRKNAEVARLGLNPIVVVQVVDMRTRRVNVYAHEAFSSKHVTRMTKVGSYDFTPEEFRRAQESTGHWQQRRQRAAAESGAG